MSNPYLEALGTEVKHGIETLKNLNLTLAEFDSEIQNVQGIDRKKIKKEINKTITPLKFAAFMLENLIKNIEVN